MLLIAIDLNYNNDNEKSCCYYINDTVITTTPTTCVAAVLCDLRKSERNDRCRLMSRADESFREKIVFAIMTDGTIFTMRYILLVQ
jgi:hypothetical protein